MTDDPLFREYRDVLYESLAGATSSIGDTSPTQVLRRVSVTAFQAVPSSAELLRPLNDVAAAPTIEAAVAAARARYPTGTAFSEAIFFARCLGRDAPQTLRLLAGRSYLLESHLTFDDEQQQELDTDRRAVLELATFHRGWLDPMRIEGSLNLIRMWRISYAEMYDKEHARQQAAVVLTFEQMEGIHVAASALQRLNTLRRLGPPVGVAALGQQQALERLFPCPAVVAGLQASLDISPVCGECGFRLGDSAPATDARRVAVAIERGLASQQARLARRVIVRLLARAAPEPETKLQRFIEVVRASDLDGLASVLDDEIVAFLDELLSEGDGGGGVLSRLARAYPAVTASNLDAAVEEFRRLLTDEAAREGIVRLRNPSDGRSSS